jgi:acyl transferase domain-containing protein/NAD(P)-dependent dehydrogenase (short-subunit alcohol dehydrogenase family)/aryl carrier-like protein
VWITGASGSIGRQLARRLAPQVDSLVLLSRSALPPDELVRLGPHVRGVQGDVTDNLVPLAAEVPPDLVFHLAGLREDADVDAIDAASLERSLQAKVDGAWRLNEVAPDAELVLVGSAAAALGNPGQGAYAAANAWLEGFARWRTAQGTPTWCVAAGPIADTSMTEGLSQHLAAMGARELGVTEALDLFLAARGNTEPVALLTPFDWARWARAVPGAHLSELADVAPDEATPPPVDLDGLVAQTTAAVLGRPSPPDEDQGFFDAGMDSLMAAELRARLATALDRPLPASVAFDHPTRRRLVAHLRSVVGPDADEAPVVSVVSSEGVDADGPIAIVGIGCRFPGGAGQPDIEGPDALWDFLAAGGDAIRPIDRWDVDATYDPEPATPGRHYVLEAGLLADVSGFDAAAFGIAPREAARMDPQQRLILEASVRALEHAGLRADRLVGSRTGVFVGIGRSEYGRRFDPLDASAEPDPHSGTGNESSFAAGRVSYVLGLQGPSMSVDTACSSSLVSLHLAVAALRNRQCRVALAGGVNAIVAPETTIQLSQLRALAPDGRCKTFDARANGYGRGEGVGMLALMRLSEARAEGRPVLAVVRGTAVNHDGASSGLTVPNGSAQRAVLAAALADAGVDPAQVALLEAHGTGTRLGDPIEVDAIRAVYVEGRDRAEPLAIGSIKAHLGHLEAGAGVAGVLRAVLSLRHGRAPAQPDLREPNPELALDGLALPDRTVPIQGRFAAVSSFGISGTNAHVVLEVGDPAPDPPTAEPRAHIVHVASGGSADAAVAMRVEADPRALGEVRRAQRFRTFAIDGVWREPVARVEGRTAWVFTGQGVQWQGMGLALRSEPAFAEAFDACATAMQDEGFDLVAALDDPGLNHTSLAQPAIFAVEIGIARWLLSRGFAPDRVVGHSLGEWSAAVVAGALPLDVAARLVVARGRVMGALPEGGASASVFTSEARVRAALEAHPDLAVDISGINGPTDTVVSGDALAVEAVLARLADEGIAARTLNVSHAFHSRHMDPAVEPFTEAVRAVASDLSVPRIPLVTNADGQEVGERALDPAHWASLIREPVRWADCIGTLLGDGVRRFVEIGPHAVLNRMTARLVEVVDPTLEVRFIETQVRPDRSPSSSGACTGTAGLYHAAGALWTSGLEPDWAALTGASRPAVLPPTPFHRVRHWVERRTDAEASLVGRLFGLERVPAAVRPVDADVVYRGDDSREALGSAQAALADGRSWAAITHAGSGVDGLARAVALSHPDQVRALTLCARDAALPDAPVSGEAWAEGAIRRLVGETPGSMLPRPDGVVLVTGGTGAVGRAVVRAWQARGARVVVLARGETSAEGLDVEVRRADVSDAEAVRAAVEGLEVRGVVHCAGLGRRVALADENASGLESVFAARVDGARVLDAVLGDGPAFFVMVSSIAAVWGSADQPAYAAANAALFGVADDRRRAGRPARVVALGPVRGEADAPGLVDDAGAAWLARRGLRVLPATVAANALLRSGPDAVLVDADWSVFAPLMAAGAFGDGLFEGLRPNGAVPTEPPPVLSRSALRDRVRSLAARVLGLPTEALDPRRGFFDAGMDSLTAVELASALARDLGRSVPSTLVFEHPTVEAVTDHLAGAGDARPAPEVARAPAAADDPIVIAGMACRFPGGVDSPDAYWQLLHDGVDAVTRVPADRWDADRVFDAEPATPGRSYVRDGAFIDGVDRFDPLFFGMSPREAAALDPQQRLLLEVAHEALERAGIRGVSHRVGVFCGIPESSYLQRFRSGEGPLYPDEYAGTGNESSFAAGRVSHALGLEGPAVSFNTACSSSLVAVHLAAEAIRAGDCVAALSGGVSLMLSPDNHIYLSQLRALAPDGRCKTFDASADGYGRGEGCGMVVLMRRSDAEARGCPVLAELLGSAVNHDGTSSGLTVPNGTAQERVVRTALERSGRAADEVTFIEAHGTGTKLGDPIEIRALQRVFADGTAPLYVASVKTQLGHLEQAAGMASLLKVVLQQQHGTLVGHLHHTETNPAIALDAARPIRIPDQPVPWTGSRLAGISGFGLSGTNAHLLVGPGDAPRSPVPEERDPHLPVPVSAGSEAGVDGLVAALDASIATYGEVPVARALARRPGLDWRAVRIDGVVTPTRRIEAAPRVALLFTGQGAQTPGMGAALLERAGTDPAFEPFRRGFLEVCSLADPHLPRPLIEAIDSDAVHDTRFTQPALFAVEWGLACWWRSLGVEADIVAGHSIGELVAATWAGMLSLADGVRLVCARANAMADLPRDGAMAAVFAPEDVVRPLLVDGAEIAGVNNPDETVLSGAEEAVEAVLTALSELPTPVSARRLTVSHAFHSAKMEPMLDGLTAMAATLGWRSPRIPVVSNLDGTLLEDPPDPAYWARQVRQAVRFADGVASLEKAGVTTVIEVGPHPVLTGHVLRQLPAVTAIATLQRRADGVATALEAAGVAWTAGLPLDWSALLGSGPAVSPADLPVTPFDRVRTWLDLPEFPTLRGPLDDALLELDWERVDGARVAAGMTSDDPAVRAALEARHQLDDAGARIHVVPAIADVDGLEAALAELLAVAQATAGPLVVVTRDAPLRVGESAAPLQRAVHGFARAAWAEHPDWVVVDVAVDDGDFADALLDGLVAGEPQLAIRPDGVYAARLASIPVPASTAPIDSERAYVVSGGLGGLGLAVARWLVEGGAGEVVLLSRTPRPERLEGLPAGTVRGVACDVGDPVAVRAVLEALERPLGGIVHAAGVLADAALAGQDADALVRVARPKVRGAVALVEAARDALAGDAWMALFSSASAVMGSAGQVPYAAANAALDGLAHGWRADGLNVTSIGWGPWAEVGMAAALDEGIRRTQRAHGIRTIPVSAGLDLLGRLLAAGRAHALVLPMDWARYLPVGGSPLLAGFGWTAASRASGAPEPLEASMRDRILAEGDPDVRVEAMTHWLVGVAREVLRIPEEREIDVGQPLMDLGMDSLMAVQVRNALDDAGFDVPIARLIGGPSIDEIRAMLLATLPESATVPTESAPDTGPGRDGGSKAPPASAGIDDWVLRPAVTHVLVALAALLLGAVAMWTVLGMTDVPVDVEADRGPPPRSEQ